jgi:predicted ATPase
VLVTSDAATRVSRPTLDLGRHRLRDIEGPVGIHQVLGPDLPRRFPPLLSLDASISTLPQHRSSFVGREAELRRVRTLLAEHRLVTVTGFGGIGKTRLAVEAAAAEQAIFPGGVFFVDLAAVADPEGIPLALATGIDLSVTRGDSVLDDVEHFLATRAVLLVVDNCEHLVDEVAALVDRLLEGAPALRVLATSREPLDVAGEVIVRLAALGPSDAAVRLFVERATAVDERFDLSATNREAVIDLCRHLDGVPLAVELAASRSAAFTPTELVDQLDDRFALLRRRRRGRTTDRQQALEATLDWSHELLDADEKRFFRRLGGFVGRFVLDVVPGVTGVGPSAAAGLLDSLVAKSLVVRTALDDQQTGYELLETVRAYALDRLADADEIDDVAARHEAAYAAWCTSRSYFGLGRWSFCRAYGAQIADLWAAADHAVDHHRPAKAVDILAAGQWAAQAAPYLPQVVARLQCLERDHADALSASSSTKLAGALGQALMDAGEFASMGPILTGVTPELDGVDAAARLQVLVPRLILQAALDRPGLDEAIAMVRAALLEDGREHDDADIPVFADSLRMFQAVRLAAHRRFDEANEVVLDTFRPWAAYHYEKTCIFHLWLSHLLGRPPSPEVVAYAGTLTLDDTSYALSAHVAAAMSTSSSVADTGRDLARIAGTMLTGRLVLEEAEFLVAFARLAQLAGDRERAADLAVAVAPRAPWTWQVLAEVIGDLEAWPAEEWTVRTMMEVLGRAQAERLAEIRGTAPDVLAEELARWRGGPD